jgi:ABC-type transport system involved in multi-copper enzyme maturation permease subunit
MTDHGDRADAGLIVSARRIFELSLGQMLWSRRSLLLALVVGGPIVLAAALRFAAALDSRALPRINGSLVSGPGLFGMMIWLIYIRFIVPVLGVFYGTALIADEVDDKTITYLFTRPIRRAAILLGKYAAFLVSTTLLVLPSIVIVYFLVVPLGGGHVGEAFPSLVADIGVVIVGLATYGALFAWIGARLRRPLVIGLLFALGWEPGVLLFPGYLRRATVAFYLQAMVPHAAPSESGVSLLLQAIQEVPSLTTAVVGLASILIVSLCLACWAVETREYVLDQ